MSGRPITADGGRAGALLIERSYREGDDRQFLRELVQNGIEADASKIQLGIHWTGVKRDWSKVELPAGHANKIFSDRYRLAYYDNGCGMGREMSDYMAGLLDLDSKGQASGDPHSNFAMGVRVSTLPWNKAGVIVASWTKDFPDGLLMWLRYVPDTSENMGYYEAATLKWLEEDGTEIFDEVAPADLFPEFIDDRPEWLGYPTEDGSVATGTMFLFLGNTGQEHTFLGPEGAWMTHTGPNYLTHRYFEHPTGLDLRYEDPRSADPSGWSARLRDRKGRTALDSSANAKPDTRILNEPVRATRPLMAGVHSRSESKPESAEIPLLDGGRILVNLLPEGKRTSGAGRQNAERPAISVLYKGELYHRRDSASDYQRFGISSADVYRRLSIVIEPRMVDGVNDPNGGVFPTGSRTALQYVQPAGSTRTGRDLPWNDWQEAFLNGMPDFVDAAIEAAQPPDTTEIDQDVVEQVAQPFMDMFEQVKWTKDPAGSSEGSASDAANIGPTGARAAVRRRKRKSGSPFPAGPAQGAETGSPRRVPAAIPECRFDENAFNSEDRQAQIRIGVKYIPAGNGRLGSVVIDPQFPLIQDRLEYWANQTAATQRHEARNVVRTAYLTAMACRVGQILALGASKELSVHTLTEGLMSNEALTCSLFGLASEHEVIKSRLSRRTRRAA